MSHMVYKRGGDELVWGLKAYVKVVEADELEAHLVEGWVDHPSKIIVENVGSESDKDMGEVSDGYHTFNELYAHRVRLFSTLMHAHKESAWWSRTHSDGVIWDGWILAGIETLVGNITYHLPESEIQNLPEGTELDTGKEWDGHTADDVLERMLSLKLPKPEVKLDKGKVDKNESDNKG
ncbi:hypothetical protein [Xenorhabdus bovienii]|uniref:WDGH domain-containing protein n=1 Tax=Xenorhabdus bovienii TaxID=40576 RepID=UPI003DA3B4A8